MLVKLLLLRLRGGVRQRLLELKTPRGLLFLAVTLVVIVLFVKQSTLPGSPLVSFFSGDSEQRKGEIARFMPIGLLAAYLLTVSTSVGPAINFSPSEINLLFCAPFTRRALLLYKLCFYAFGALLSSLLIMLLAPTFTYKSLAALSGAFLGLLFIQLLTITTGLLGQWIESDIDVSLRPSRVFIMLISLIAAAGWYDADIFSGLTGAVYQFQSSTMGTVLLAPFDVFSRIFLAQSIFPDLVLWTTLGVAINLGLLAVVILLDGRISVVSTAASLKLQQRWDKPRHSGLPWGAHPTLVRSVTHPPVLGGIGPVAWRQMLFACRNSGKVLSVYLVLAIPAGPLLVAAGHEISLWTLIGGVFFAAVFVLPRTLVFDFRSDLEAMANFKMLPLSSWKICAGQLISAVLFTSLIELVLLATTAVFLDGKWNFFLIGIGFFLLPFNLLLYGLENFFFLLFPAPLVPVGRADFDFLGRTLVGYAVTTAFLIGSGFLAVAAGQVIASAMGWTWPILMVVAWLSFTLIALLTLPLLSWAFSRFDVSLR